MAKLTIQQIIDVLRNDVPDFAALYGENTAALHSAVRTWDLAISVVETLAEKTFDDWQQLPEAEVAE